jgi:hypothetical protein
MTMFAVLAEDHSDAESLVTLVKRISGMPRLPVKSKGFGGCGELCRKAWSHIQTFADQGATHFIVCHDSDGNDDREIQLKVETAIKNKMVLNHPHCIVVPVQEIEAWVIADEDAIRRVIPTLSIKGVPSPESVGSPKEWLRKESKRGRSKPLYVPTIHNRKVMEQINLAKLEMKCPAFGPLKQFVVSA